MSRRKIVNKEKFVFKEEEVLPPRPGPSRVSVQRRLTPKAGLGPSFVKPREERVTGVVLREHLPCSRGFKEDPNREEIDAQRRVARNQGQRIVSESCTGNTSSFDGR